MIKTVDKGAKTPFIEADSDKANLKISGVIIPENPVPIFDEIWELCKFVLEKNKEIKVEFDLDYFNTGAARYLYDFLKKLKETGNHSVIWRYESDDEDILESGEEFQAMTGFNFDFIVKP